MKKITIIGSGLVGLTAGNQLAKKGHQFTIFESHSNPGGYIGGFWRKGFHSEIYEADYVISACYYKQTFQKLPDPGIVPPGSEPPRLL
jgi:phytoene dehydrogenase-like protein